LSLFEYVMIPPAIVLGLAITHILSGLGRIVHRLAGHGSPIRMDVVHLTWVAHIFSWIVFFWWYSYAWTTRFEWSLLVFVFLILYAVALYLMCVVLIPSDLDEVEDFESYFLSLRTWFFRGGGGPHSHRLRGQRGEGVGQRHRPRAGLRQPA
jgi:hypothetical protein